MSKVRDRQGAAFRKAEALLADKSRKESDRLTNRENDRRAQDEKIARLRDLRLAKEAADRNEAKPFAPSASKKAGHGRPV